MLFQPLTLGGLELPNRIVVSPMGQYSARDGCATDWHMMHLGHLAVSGAGLLIAEAAAVHPDGRSSDADLGIWSDRQAAALEPVVAFCRRHGGARLGIQIYHAGRKGSITSAWEGQHYVPPERGGWPTCAPSAIPYPGRGMPVVLDGAGMAAVTDAPSEEFWNAMRLNVFGTWLCSRYALPHIVAAGGGAIVNTSSIVAIKGIAGKHAYAAAKGAIVSLTRTMAVEYAPQKVRVNAIAPSVTMTDRVKGFLQASNRSSGLAAMHMLGLGEPDDIAAGALYLASDESRLVTGQVLSIDSGVSIR